MIVANLTIGLGNQLFQYASGLGIAEQLGRDFVYDDWSPFGCGAQHNELRHFHISKQAITPQAFSSISPLLKFPSSFLHKILPRSRLLEKLSVHHIYVEKSLEYKDFPAGNLKSPLYLMGFWQNYRYFENIKRRLEKDLAFLSPLSPRTLLRAQQIQSSPSVFIHVRRGDYLTPSAQAAHGSTKFEYYEAAYRKICGLAPDVTAFVFSDDISWCRSAFPFLQKVEFIDHTNAASAYEDLYMMSICNYGILANSSFSWWGAWLGQHNKRMLIAPSKWYENPILNKQAEGICPPNWVRL